MSPCELKDSESQGTWHFFKDSLMEHKAIVHPLAWENEWRSKESSIEGTHDSASAQQNHAGDRNKEKLAQGYKNPACIGRDDIKKATLGSKGIKGSRNFQHWIRNKGKREIGT